MARGKRTGRDFTAAVRQALRERNLTLMQVNRERRERYKHRRAYERELLAQEEANVTR